MQDVGVPGNKHNIHLRSTKKHVSVVLYDVMGKHIVYVRQVFTKQTLRIVKLSDIFMLLFTFFVCAQSL